MRCGICGSECPEERNVVSWRQGAGETHALSLCDRCIKNLSEYIRKGKRRGSVQLKPIGRPKCGGNPEGFCGSDCKFYYARTVGRRVICKICEQLLNEERCNQSCRHYTKDQRGRQPNA